MSIINLKQDEISTVGGGLSFHGLFNYGGIFIGIAAGIASTFVINERRMHAADIRGWAKLVAVGTACTAVGQFVSAYIGSFIGNCIDYSLSLGSYTNVANITISNVTVNEGRKNLEL